MGGGQGNPAMPGQMGQGMPSGYQMPTMNTAAPMGQPFNYQQAQQNAMGMAPQAMQQFQQMRNPMQQMPEEQRRYGISPIEMGGRMYGPEIAFPGGVPAQPGMRGMPPDMAYAGKGPSALQPWMNPGGFRTGGLLG